MSSWSVLTLSFDESREKYGEGVSIPTGLRIDNGVDEMCWLEQDERFYVMSQGRYQDKRFIEHAKQIHDPRFNGVEYVAIADVEDTGDSATVYIYEPVTDYFPVRKDGFRRCDTFEGRRFPKEEREELKNRVEEEYGFRPRIETVNEAVKPDMIVRKTKEDEEVESDE